MKRYICLFALLSFLSISPAYAAGEVIHAKVLGMVCEFCAESIMKVFQKNDGVEKIDIDLDNQLVTITLKDGASLSDEEIKKGIDYGGYDLESINRNTPATP